jgi:hypothetical protein
MVGTDVIALILGGAECLWDDLHAFLVACHAPAGLILRGATLIATNLAGVHYPEEVPHWVTRHPENWVGLPQGEPGWLAQRAAKFPGWRPSVRWSNVYLAGIVDRVVKPWGGSSGLLAVTVAIAHLNADRVVLCGMPMDKRGHFDRQDEWKSATTFQGEWKKALPRMGDRVRSLSGWTRSVHGAPTEAWVFGAGGKDHEHMQGATRRWPDPVRPG